MVFTTFFESCRSFVLICCKFLGSIFNKSVLRFLMFYQLFFSPQMKRYAIVNYKHVMYELPHELPNNSRLQKSVKTSQNESLVACPSAKMKVFLILAKNFSKAEIKLFPYCTISHEN